MMPLLVYALALSTLTPATVGPGECVVFAPLGGQTQVIGGDECSRRTLPASTFKVPHALVALETGVVTEKSVIKWDGTKRDYAVWNRDQTLDSAIKMSAVWVFQQFAAAIGRERELSYLRSFQYGSATFERGVTDFWLNGDLTITPAEEVAFLQRMFTYDLPVARKHIDVVKAAVSLCSRAASDRRPARSTRRPAPTWPFACSTRSGHPQDNARKKPRRPQRPQSHDFALRSLRSRRFLL